MDKWREDVYTWCKVHVVHGVRRSITTVTRIFGDLVLNRAELRSRINVKILIARLHVRDSCLLESVVV
jgi:hypothetical protein